MILSQYTFAIKHMTPRNAPAALRSSIGCPLCQAEGRASAYLEYGQYQWQRCSNCAFGFQVPYVAEHLRTNAGNDISDTYSAFSEESLPPSVTDEKCQWVLSSCTAQRALLIEIGPGRGQLLDAVRRARNEWVVFAVEPYQKFVSILQARGIRVVPSVRALGTNSDIQLAAQGCTQLVVVADNVLEHLEHPVEVLRELRMLAASLNLPLVVLIEVPNERALSWRHGLQDLLRGFKKAPTFPGHINLFEKATLVRAAYAAGFGGISVKGHAIRTTAQLEYLLRDQVRSKLAIAAVFVLSLMPLDSWLGLAYWLRGELRSAPHSAK